MHQWPDLDVFSGFPPRGWAGHSMADHGYDASEEGSVDDFPEVMVKIYPLVMLTIHQPHFLATCTNSSQKMEVSCFDASTHLSPHNYFITCGGHRVPLPLDYQVTYWSPTQFNSVAFLFSIKDH